MMSRVLRQYGSELEGTTLPVEVCGLSLSVTHVSENEGLLKEESHEMKGLFNAAQRGSALMQPSIVGLIHKL